jgi:hypothetical protein
MGNKDLTEARVRNVMKQIPKEQIAKRQSKVRNTMKQTFSGMKTLLGQLAQGNTNRIRAERRRKRRLVLTIAISILLLIAIVIGIIVW